MLQAEENLPSRLNHPGYTGPPIELSVVLPVERSTVSALEENNFDPLPFSEIPPPSYEEVMSGDSVTNLPKRSRRGTLIKLYL